MDIAEFVVVIGCLLVSTGVHGTPACDSEIYCYGDLLDTIQTSGIFTDSKEFVDRPLKDDPATVLGAFQNLSDRSNASLLQFVEQWTENVTADFVPWEPPDWVERPAFIDSIKDSQLQKWALDLNALWKTFGKEVNPSVREDQQDRHSLILVPHPYIAPGAGSRFREFYYWDSYWILEGILLCGMDRTAQNMIENLAEMVDRYGLVPNGGRVYYTERSQPPLLTQMVNLYYSVTGNKTFLEKMLPCLDDEHRFWIENRTVNVNVTSFPLNRYAADLTDPRPESYREDLETAMEVSEGDRPELYSNLASAAESGWDFSSRWFNQSGELSSIRTKRIVPVDLNAILCENEATLARLYEIIGNSTVAKDYTERAKRRRDAIEAVFWNENEGLWLDWDLDTMEHLHGFYASSLVPLYWGCGPTNLTRHQRVHSRLQELGVLDYPGGIPTSLNMNSTQQWDFPNAWAPLQWFPVLAWYDSTDETLREAARAIAKTWITSTFSGWEKYNMTMFEKYNCTVAGMPGGGGEYAIQSGFGWTNGVVLHFLSLYPDTLSETHSSSQSLGWVAAVVIFAVAIAVIIACVLWGRWIYLSGHKRYWARVQSEHLIATGGGAATTPPTSPIVYTNQYTDSDGILAKPFEFDT